MQLSFSQWNLTDRPWHCDKNCRKSIETIEIDSTGCISPSK